MAKLRLTRPRWGAALRWCVVLLLGVGIIFGVRHVIQLTVVNGHSMDPTYATGDLLVSAPAPAYHIGDVITYHPRIITNCDMCNVVHRIVRGNATHGWITQGDNNPNEDGWLVKAGDIRGRVLLHVPVPAIFRITYLPAFWIFISSTAFAIWLFLRAWEEEEESTGKEPSGPRHRAGRLGPRHRLES